jgi:malonate transporter MadM subunit
MSWPPDWLITLLEKNSLITAFFVVGSILWFSSFLSTTLTRGRIHGSAIAIFMGLALAYMGGIVMEGEKGFADVPLMAGIGLLGGSMFRDLAIVATAFGVRLQEFLATGLSGVISLILGFGYRDAVSITTIGAGAATYIVGPVTGGALEASSEVIALSVAAGLVKSILVMTLTPFVAKSIGLDNPRSALIFGGLMGTTSGVAAGLAATDAKLVPYGAMTATFYTGLGCLLGPSLIFMLIKAIV